MHGEKPAASVGSRFCSAVVDAEAGVTAPPTPLPQAVAAVPDDGLGVWEDEGGGQPVCAETRQPGPHGVQARPSWYEFLAARFPRRRRHDMEALKAYESQWESSGPHVP